MRKPTIEERLSALEAAVEELKRRQLGSGVPAEMPWWQKIYGSHKDDPEYEEAMRLGREYRESLRPAYYEAAE